MGKNAVSAAAAAVQQSLLRMEKVRTPPSPFAFSTCRLIFSRPLVTLTLANQTGPAAAAADFLPTRPSSPRRSHQAAAEGTPSSPPRLPSSATALSEQRRPPLGSRERGEARKMSLGGASSAGMSTGGGTAEKDKDKGGKGLGTFR